ncbi:MAG TPA: cobalamin-binding protein [Gammaproteobacteria bacterium]|nr:cobalamin-binding protein [Gammaproteobacteria bacterium]
MKHPGVRAAWLAAVSLTAVVFAATVKAAGAPPLPVPAQRIVSLAPHLTELLFSAGAGERIVGTVAYSDYPPEARRIPRVGDAFHLDLERILALRPDLVVAWRSGIRDEDLQRLRTLGFPVYVADSTRLAGIASELEDLGRLAGTGKQARAAARDYLDRLRALTARYQGRAPVTVFYQVWDRPLMTVSDRHVIGQVIRRCGGRNPFGDLAELTPTVDPEALVAADPQVMIAAAGGGDPFARWRDMPVLRAVRAGHLFTVPGDWISRPSLRLLQGMARVCAILDEVRDARDEGEAGGDATGALQRRPSGSAAGPSRTAGRTGG